VQAYGLNYFDVTGRDIREGHVITRSEIQTKNIRSLGVRDTKVGRSDITKVGITELRAYYSHAKLLLS